MGEALGGRRRWIWGAVAVVVLALAGFGAVRAVTADATDDPEAAETVAVDKGTVTTEVATTGTVQPAQTRSLSFSVAGTVESVAVRAGTSVTAGQVLAEVDDTDAAEAVGDAQDSLDDAEDALAEAEDNAANAATGNGDGCGSNVAAGYAVAATTPSTRSLTIGATPKPTSTVPTPTPSATSTPSATPTTTTAPTRTGVPTGTTAPAGSTAPGRPGSGGNPSGNPGAGASCAASGGNQQGGSQQQGGGDAILSAEQRVTQARTALENAEEALAGATIKAPIAGRVLSVSGKVGSQVGAGNSFITLADVHDMQISANFPEADADRLAVRQKAVVTLADRVGAEFHATVVQVDPVGTSDGTMVRYGVLLSFDDKPEDLLVGQSASVRVTTGARSEVLRVPSAAVHDVAGDKGVVRKGNATIEVTIGLRGDQHTEIIEGLSAGDEIVRTW